MALWRRLWDRCHLTLSVECPRLWCLKGDEGVLQESHTAVPETAAAPSPNSSEEGCRNPAAQNRLWQTLGNTEELLPHCECSKSQQLFLNVEMTLLLLLCSRIEFSPCLNCFGACRKEVLSMPFNFFKRHQCFSLKSYLQCFSVIK